MDILVSGGGTKSISKMYVGINDVARPVQKAYIGVNGVARLWYQSEAPAGNLAIGTTVKGIYGDEEFIVVHNGNPNTSVYDASCDGVWLMAKNCVASLKLNSSRTRNITSNSPLMDWLNSTFYNALTIKDSIKTVKIPYYGPGGGLSEAPPLYTGANGFSTKVFIPSGHEVGLTGTEVTMYMEDGRTLAYFTDHDTADPKRVATLNGSATEWWLRTPRKDNKWYISSQSLRITQDGSHGKGWVNEEWGVRPIFIVPSDLKIKV